MPESEDFYRAAQAVCVSEEYSAGYQAFLDGEAELQTATTSWRAGVWDAAREMQVDGAAFKQAYWANRANERWSPQEAGQAARLCELPFDESLCAVWKQTWIKTDLMLGLKGRRRG